MPVEEEILQIGFRMCGAFGYIVSYSSKQNDIDWSHYGYEFRKDKGWVPRQVCVTENCKENR